MPVENPVETVENLMLSTVFPILFTGVAKNIFEENGRENGCYFLDLNDYVAGFMFAVIVVKLGKSWQFL